MSLSVASRPQSYRPYECSVCNIKFTRHENLKRHAARHSRSYGEASPLACELCDTTFSRPDLRNRHMKRKHPEHEVKRAPKVGRNQRLRGGSSRGSEDDRTPSASPTDSQSFGEGVGSERGSDIWQPRLQAGFGGISFQDADRTPTSSGISIHSVPPHGPDASAFIGPGSLGSEASYIDQILREADAGHGPSMFTVGSHTSSILPNLPTPGFYDTLGNLNFDPGITQGLLSNDFSDRSQDWSPSDSQLAHGCELFFDHISPFLPFLHQATFDVHRAPNYLVLSMLCLAYQHGEDPDSGKPSSGNDLSLRCYQQVRASISDSMPETDHLEENVAMVQTLLLLQIYTMMYVCGRTESAHGHKMHSKMIELSRSGGLMQPATVEPSDTEDLDALWHRFVKAESCKRTVFAVHQIDALWYHLLSIPRRISNLEVKQELPCPSDYWSARSASEWAHRQLIARESGVSLQFTDAVRYFLSANIQDHCLRAFDPYGAVNITQFLMSSAREISGWSTMTGVLSVERFEPLRSSLISLRPFTHQQAGVSTGASTALGEATWETAMLELHLWSPSHTSGVVEGSMDGVLKKSINQTLSSEILCKSDTAKAVQPHVNWFLQYLDKRHLQEAEAPWIALYAYEAFLIAWQLLRGAVPGAMEAVNIQDGDLEGAKIWAKNAFERRPHGQLSRLILSCLDELPM